jgi:photosystem II stability/assembly factor-like uncharacterized protein
MLIGSCTAKTKNIIENESKQNKTSPIPDKSQNETTDGAIFFSNNNGLTWQNKSKGLPNSINLGLGAIAVSENLLGTAIKEYGVYLFDFQKDIWVNIPTDKQILDGNLGTMTFFKNRIFIGTQMSGVFSTADNGKNWIKFNTGLTNLSIRKLIQIDDKLYAGTDAGLFSYNEPDDKWNLEFGNKTMQVNGMTDFDGSIYIGSNQGAFATPKGRKDWKQILANRTLHNISSDDNTIYAMVYNELLSSKDKGKSWQNIQDGLPKELYTFNVIKNGNSLFAGQWDGVYRKDSANEVWKSYSDGLPNKLAISNMKLYKGIIVISGNERGLKKGMTTDK